MKKVLKDVLKVIFYFASGVFFAIFLFCVAAITCGIFKIISIDIFWPGMIFALLLTGLGAIGFFKKAISLRHKS